MSGTDKRKKPFDLNKFVISHLRRQWHKSPQRSMALALALRPYGNYECAVCKQWFKEEEIEVDHVEPVIPLEGWAGFDISIPRLFCPAAGLQILCQAKCHAAKSAHENAERRKHRKAKAE